MMIPSRRFDPAKAWNLDFGGTDDNYYVTVPSSSVFAPSTNKMAIDFWVYPKSSDAMSSIFWRLDADNNRRCFVVRFSTYEAQNVSAAFYQDPGVPTIRDHFYTAQDTITLNQWQNIHIDMDISGTSTVAAIYVDNDSKSLTWERKNNISQFADATEDLAMGYRTDTAPRVPLDGHLMNVCFFDFIPTAAYRKQIINHRLTGREQGLIAYYPFLDKTGTTLKDWSNNKIDGTITGATWQRGI